MFRLVTILWFFFLFPNLDTGIRLIDFILLAIFTFGFAHYHHVWLQTLWMDV